ncbi:MAG: nuclear transport factor 2 family protein [Halothiobacillus sp.]|jgi:ketosteroid isomerase-like protein|nr:nuclear transport factor 2 family protein [Halothiobacillus sp.]HUX81659.1 nuclear transport factor 2 family protein [Halothiobacillus sp.]
MKILSVFALAGSLGLGLVSGSAIAGPADDAKAHFNAIGSGDIDQITSAYTGDSRFYWIGGPLDGDYTGTDAIRGVWAKFTKVQGDMKVSVEKLEEAGNPKGTTVTANVVFAGKATIKVRYVLTYRGDKLVSETWQIAPKLAVGGGY